MRNYKLIDNDVTIDNEHEMIPILFHLTTWWN